MDYDWVLTQLWAEYLQALIHHNAAQGRLISAEIETITVLREQESLARVRSLWPDANVLETA